jgi:hypothetical protein
VREIWLLDSTPRSANVRKAADLSDGENHSEDGSDRASTSSEGGADTLRSILHSPDRHLRACRLGLTDCRAEPAGNVKRPLSAPRVTFATTMQWSDIVDARCAVPLCSRRTRRHCVARSITLWKALLLHPSQASRVDLQAVTLAVARAPSLI